MKDPNFDIAFSIGGFNIYWYAILLAAGIAAAMLITDIRAKGRKVPKDIALDMCILGVPFGVLGARLFSCLSGAVDWASFFDLTRSGLSFFGGLVFAALAILTYLKLRKVSLDEMLDVAAPGTFVGIGISVWGDFFNRNHYGPLVEKASHKWFPLATFGSDLKIHYAAFFYEFLLCAVLVVLYYALLRKTIRRKGDRFFWMSLIYCLGRFGIDSIRQDLIMVGPIAFDQLCEIALSVLFLLLLALYRRPNSSKEPTHAPANPPENNEVKAQASQGSSDEPDQEKPFTGLN